MNLTELVKGNFVYFDSYRQGVLYYHLLTMEEVPAEPPFSTKQIYPKYQFTVPIDDVGNGTMRSPMKAIECLRWIRKAHEANELIKVS